jgi:hypothetical protein
MALVNSIEATVDLVQAYVEICDGALLGLQTVCDALVARAENWHEARCRLVLKCLFPLARVFVGLWLVEGDVRFVDLVVEVVLEDAAGA